MILETEIEEKQEEMKTLEQDALALDTSIKSALDSNDAELVMELKSKKKGLIQYLQDLIDEVSGTQALFRRVGGGEDEDKEGEEEEYEGDEKDAEKARNQTGSFGHTLVNSTIPDREEGASGGSGEGDGVQDEVGASRDRQEIYEEYQSLYQAPENFEDGEAFEEEGEIDGRDP